MDLKTTIFSKILNMNKRKLGIIIIIIFVSILILFPFIDTNFFYANRIKSRIDILQKITELDMGKINQDKNLTKEYKSIVKEISESDNNYINKILKNNKNDHTVGKFISGGILWWLLGVTVLFFYNVFNKESKNLRTRIAGFIVCIIIGGLIGLICSIIPTIFNIWINYIVVPVLVLISMILLLYKTTSNN